MKNCETAGLMPIEVVYATAEEQVLLALCVPEGTTAAEAVALSGLPQRFAALSGNLKLGVFGKVASAQTRLHPHDRVEVYRPLQVDPKQARRLRAQAKAEQGGSVD